MHPNAADTVRTCTMNMTLKAASSTAIVNYSKIITVRTCTMNMTSKAASSTAIVNYSKIITMKYTTMERFEKYINNGKTNFSTFFTLEYF